MYIHMLLSCALDSLIYELFKPSLAGNDLHLSPHKLFNLIKENMIVPSFFEVMSITRFYKHRGSINQLSNQRGIFNLPKVRSILDRLIYDKSYEEIDRNLSFSNAGGRKGRSIRDHIFVVYSIINDVMNGNASESDFQFVDIIKCFDELAYCKIYNDLLEAEIENDSFLFCQN